MTNLSIVEELDVEHWRENKRYMASKGNWKEVERINKILRMKGVDI